MSSLFGGINFMEFRMEQNLIHPLRIQAETLLELEESLVLCDSGIAHESGEIHEDQRAQMSDDKMRDQVAENAQLSYDMRNALLRGKLRDFGLLLDQAWQAKRRVSKKISSLKLDAIYDSAKQHGALGGKLLGAGGGGFFLFYAPPYQKHALLSHLKSNGLSAQSFRFEERGLQAWTVRESKNQPMAPL
jgi:D-glycero-alpha-D-manno-heptose-7-phosphate kinase